MLRLVPPPGEGKAPARRRKGRSPKLSLTAEETRHLRAAIRNLSRAFGSQACLAAAIGVHEGTLNQALYRNRKRPSAALALRLAQVGGMSVEAVLTGVLGPAGRCPTCGAHLGHGAVLPSRGGGREPPPSCA